MGYAEVLIDEIEHSKSFLSCFCTPDEPHFHLYGHVNFKNNIYWSTQSHIEIRKEVLHSARVTPYTVVSHIYTYDRAKTLSFISLIRRKNTEFENESNV